MPLRPDSPVPAVDRAICERRTVKVEADGDAPTAGVTPRAEIEAVLAVAGLAPFHHVASRAGEAAEPWRAHLLDAAACRALRRTAQADGAGGRVPRMLAAASALAVVTWMPEGPMARGPRVRFEGTLVNMEHVAAGGAFVQNVLVAATARGLPTYWSSGGWLATPAGLEAVGARPEELLLGAVFVFPAALAGADVTTPGKHHARRSPAAAWSRWVEA